MSKTDAAYMRAYRARRKAIITGLVEDADRDRALVAEMDGSARIAELEEEVRHLKEELAKRFTSQSAKAAAVKLGYLPPTMTNAIARGSGPDGRGVSGFNTRPFTPVPKHKGK